MPGSRRPARLAASASYTSAAFLEPAGILNTPSFDAVFEDPIVVPVEKSEKLLDLRRNSCLPETVVVSKSKALVFSRVYVCDFLSSWKGISGNAG